MKRVKAKPPESYIEREYRVFPDLGSLISSFVTIKDTDLHILADKEVSGLATELALQYRLQVEQYILQHPDFAHSLVPLPLDHLAPPLVRGMLVAGQKAGVGPMAAVAGGIAEYVGKGLLQSGCREVMVENGGDLFVQRLQDCRVAIFAGESPFNLRVGVQVSVDNMPLGVCTSSGTIGHSLSFGLADSVTVLARSTLLADAVATRLGNEIGRTRGGDSGIKAALEKSRTIDEVLGVVAICGVHIGAIGDVELVNLG